MENFYIFENFIKSVKTLKSKLNFDDAETPKVPCQVVAHVHLPLLAFSPIVAPFSLDSSLYAFALTCDVAIHFDRASAFLAFAIFAWSCQQFLRASFLLVGRRLLWLWSELDI